MAFPKCGDAYTSCFYAAVEKHGVVVIDGVLSGRWLLSHLREVDYLHINWPSFFYRHADPIRSLRRFGRFVALLLYARILGVKLIWTAHNLYPHDRNSLPILDRLGRHLVVKLASRIYAHGETAAGLVRREFPASRNKITVIELGHFLDLYEKSATKEVARRRLGIHNSSFVFLCLGACKEYKNLELLVEAFQSGIGDAELLIVGRFQDPDYYRRVMGKVNRKPQGIRVEDGLVPDDEVQYYVLSADVFLAPYSRVLTSGSAMLGLSFGRPVIAPRLGHLIDLLTEQCGVLYDPNDSESLRQAMKTIRNRRYDEEQIVSYARTYDWDRITRRFLDALPPSSRR